MQPQYVIFFSTAFGNENILKKWINTNERNVLLQTSTTLKIHPGKGPQMFTFLDFKTVKTTTINIKILTFLLCAVWSLQVHRIGQFTFCSYATLQHLIISVLSNPGESTLTPTCLFKFYMENKGSLPYTLSNYLPLFCGIALLIKFKVLTSWS